MHPTGPDTFQTNNLTISLDLMIEDSAIFTIGTGGVTIALDTKGTYTLATSHHAPSTGAVRTLFAQFAATFSSWYYYLGA
jgi:hypothetical protein